VNRRQPNRRAYALVIVLLFNVLFLMLIGVTWRRMASVIRIATVRAEEIERDEGRLQVLAQAMRLLETGLPPAISYERGATITLGVSGDVRFFNVRFER